MFEMIIIPSNYASQILFVVCLLWVLIGGIRDIVKKTGSSLKYASIPAAGAIVTWLIPVLYELLSYPP